MRRILVLLGALFTFRFLRRHPAACPYAARIFVELPHPLITRRRLLAMLDPRPDERILELGPGTGYYSLAVARKCRLTVVDKQQSMLDHVARRAEAAGVELELVPADGRSLPFADGSFEAAYLVTVLGEIPDQLQALHELHRVLRPGGRLVVGELLLDPHWVAPRALRRRAEAVGFASVERAGTAGYFARFTRP